MAKTYDYLFKLLLIGDSGVGKTCLLFRFSEDAFNTTFISTIGESARTEPDRYRPALADQSGIRSMRTRSSLFQGIMLVYDITTEKSFDNIRNWIRNIEEVVGDEFAQHRRMKVRMRRSRSVTDLCGSRKQQKVSLPAQDRNRKQLTVTHSLLSAAVISHP
uniref:small monomeric GTPase n=1 Tax=Stegastes partitus TaxID=144197 RepID=A0A3B5AMG2_9TELE